jgi:hypothetical protein
MYLTVTRETNWELFHENIKIMEFYCSFYYIDIPFPSTSLFTEHFYDFPFPLLGSKW